MPREFTAAVRQAMDVIGSPPGDSRELYTLADRLVREDQVGYARKVLEKARESEGGEGELRVRIMHLLALCTYKDPDLPMEDRLSRAAVMVQNLLANAALSPSMRQELTGISGGIYKQRWIAFGMRSHLETALTYYLQGYALGIELDMGYTGINAAFVLDLLADLDMSGAGSATEIGRQRQEQARQIRQQVIAYLQGTSSQTSSWWRCCTMADAYLGLGEYTEASHWARRAASLGTTGWRMETAARQLAHLARLQARKEGRKPEELEQSEAWIVVRELLGGNADAALSMFRGKVGLALSGGGFRASLFHIGVLAKLAELDMLRQVEVLSCVSGGSILGAYYYLELRNLLETKTDDEITREDYMAAVKRVEVNFLAGVQRNIRMRLLAGFSSNLKVLTSRTASTCHRLGDLYEEELYSRIDDGGGNHPRYLDELFIRPKGAPEDFQPKRNNWMRKAKVPILILNATSLNTCHSWQFTASFMGEPPPRSIDAEIDANDRLRRMYYEDAPPAYRRVRLGHAVAASSCVPGLFDPLVLDGLYQQGYVTRLADGGVYDNQGLVALREQDCTVLLVSDASGQTAIDKNPSGSHFGVPVRANNILMTRVREEQYLRLASLRDTGVLRGVLFVHLKKGLVAQPVDWTDCPDPSSPARHNVLTRYRIRTDVQTKLAAIRTDLDSFCDAEADALMLSGYRMVENEFDQCIEGFPKLPAPPPVWRFLDIAPLIGSPVSDPGLKDLHRLLDAAAERAFKLWHLSPGLKVAAWVLRAVALLAVLWLCRALWTRSLVVGEVLLAIAAAGVAYRLAQTLMRRLHFVNPLWQVLASLLMCIGGWAVLAFHLRFIDSRYLVYGPRYRSAEPEEREPVVKGAAGGATD